MNTSAWIQLILYVALLLAITKPLGLYLCKVLDRDGKTFLDPVIKPFERLTYKLTGVDAKQEQDWKRYTAAMLLFSLVSMLFTYAILRLQAFLPLNPQKLAALSEHLSFNTAASFTTNTNWQSYGGEGTMSYFSQMVALTIHNFVSAAVGISHRRSVWCAGLHDTPRRRSATSGSISFASPYYLLLPICIVFAVVLVSQGMIQNFKPFETASLTEPVHAQVEKKDDKGETVKDAAGKPVMEDQVTDTQSIVQGPMASQIAIKMLGTNGGGYANANAAHPFENPTPLSNFLQILSIFAIPSALTYYLGRTVKNQGHGWAVWAAMFTSLLCRRDGGRAL